MAILKPRKNKKFGYEPRYYKHDGEGTPFQIEHKFDKFRTTVGDNKGLKAKFASVLDEIKSASDKKSNRIVLIIVAIFVLIFLFIIDFDLSIFLHN